MPDKLTPSGKLRQPVLWVVTFYVFRLLSPLFQLQHVVVEGTFLAHRWESEQHRVNLYHLDDGGRGFFAEVSYDDALVERQVLRCFVSSVAPAARRLHAKGATTPVLGPAPWQLPSST